MRALNLNNIYIFMFIIIILIVSVYESWMFILFVYVKRIIMTKAGVESANENWKFQLSYISPCSVVNNEFCYIINFSSLSLCR